MHGHRWEYCIIPVLFIVADRVVVVADVGTVDWDDGAGEFDLCAVVVDPLLVPETFTGLSLVARAKKINKLQFSKDISFYLLYYYYYSMNLLLLNEWLLMDYLIK